MQQAGAVNWPEYLFTLKNLSLSFFCDSCLTSSSDVMDLSGVCTKNKCGKNKINVHFKHEILFECDLHKYLSMNCGINPGRATVNA